MSEPSPAIPDQVFYRYDGPDGNVVLVDSLDKLPPDVRPKAKRLVYEGSSRSLQGTLNDLLTGNDDWQATSTSTSSAANPEAVLGLHTPSFVLGVGTGLGVFFVLSWFLRPQSTSFGKRLLVSVALTAGVAAVLGGAYFGWLRRTTGQAGGVVATPSQLIEDAKRTMREVEERRKEQQRQLDELDRAAK